MGRSLFGRKKVDDQSNSSKEWERSNIVETVKSNITPLISWEWLISVKKNFNWSFNLQNTNTGKIIANYIDSYYINEWNPGDFPIWIRIKLDNNTSMRDTSSYRRHYINSDGEVISPEYTKPISRFNKKWKAIITHDNLKQTFIDSDCKEVIIDWIRFFEEIRQSDTGDEYVYLAKSEDKSFILNSDLSKLDNIWDLYTRDHVSILFFGKDKFITIDRDGKTLEFYNFEGQKIDDKIIQDHKLNTIIEMRKNILNQNTEGFVSI